MIEDNSVLPYLKVTLKKFAYLYAPILLIDGYFYDIQQIEYWLVFFLCSFTLEIVHNFSLQNSQWYKASYVITLVWWGDKFFSVTKKYVLEYLFLTKTWSLIGIIFVAFYVVSCLFYNIPFFSIKESTLSFLEIFLPTYIWIFGVLLWLWITTLQKTQDKYSEITTRKIMGYIGWKILLGYIVTFIVFAFLVFLYSVDNIENYPNAILNYDFYFLSNFFFLTFIFVLLAKDFFYASTAQWILKIFSFDLISRIKKSSTKDIYQFTKKRDFQEDYKKKLARERRRSLYTSILFKGWSFLLGKPIYPTMWYLKWDITKELKVETQVLFRIWLNSLEEKNAITLKYCLENVVKVFSAYIQYGKEYNGSDDFSIFIHQEFNFLFDKALKYDYQPEFLEIITKSLWELTIEASKVEIKNFQWVSETDIFEKQLTEFALKSWSKMDSGATSLSLYALNDIANSYIENNKIELAFNTLTHLLEVWEVVAWLETLWSDSITRVILHYSTQIYYNVFIQVLYWEKDIDLNRIYRNEFHEHITKILKILYSSSKRKEYHHRFSDVFYSDLFSWNIFDRWNKNKHRPIYDYFQQIVFWYLYWGKKYWGVPSTENKRKQLYKEITLIFGVVRDIFPTSLKNHTQMQDMSGFLYSMTDIIQKLCIYEENQELKDILIECLNRNISDLYKDLSDFKSFDDEGGANMFCLIILLLVLLHKDFEVENLVVKTLSNIIETFKNLDEAQDYHQHKRKYIFKYLFFLSAWTWKFFPSSSLHNNLEKFILDNKEFKDKYSSQGYWWHSDWEKFDVYNYPESWIDRLLRQPDTRIWTSTLTCFSELEIIVTPEEYKEYCEYLNQKLVLT